MPPTMSAPEAEPQEQQNAPTPPVKREKAPGGDGSSLQLPPALQKKVIEQHNAATKPESKHWVPYFDRIRDGTRGKIGTLLYGGAFLANPVVGATLYFGDKLARATVSKVPIVQHAYELPRKAVMGAANLVQEGATTAVAAPGYAIDRVHDVYQGIRGIETDESKTMLGSVIEQTTEFIGNSIKFAKEKGTWLGQKSLSAIEKTLEASVKIIGGTLSIPYHLASGVMKKTAHAAAAGPTGIATSALTTALIGWGAWTWGMGFPASGYWPWLGGIIQKGVGAARMAIGV